ncbi:MAG: hypothetical protein ABEJ61_10560 [Haloferacaceae archaeon]
MGDAKAGSSGDAGATARPGVDRTALGYALLFSLPVGVGVALAMMRATGGGVLDPLVALPGLVAGSVLFLLVLVAASNRVPAEA